MTSHIHMTMVKSWYYCNVAFKGSKLLIKHLLFFLTLLYAFYHGGHFNNLEENHPPALRNMWEIMITNTNCSLCVKHSSSWQLNVNDLMPTKGLCDAGRRWPDHLVPWPDLTPNQTNQKHHIMNFSLVYTWHRHISHALKHLQADQHKIQSLF